MQINSVDWRFECYRLQSFSIVESNEPVSFVRLAKEGFIILFIKNFTIIINLNGIKDECIPDYRVEQYQHIPTQTDRMPSV